MKTKLIIAGTGAVGGYFGGLMARHYEGNPDVEISFIARGAHLKEIQNNGLKVVKGDTSFVAHPAIATDNPSEIGVADFIIIATKGYDLESMLEHVRPCIDAHTILLPLLNGVDSRERIQPLFPDNLVLDGCVYIVSRLKEPGVIENSANIETLYFGLDNFTNERLVQLEGLMKEAHVQATLSQNISGILWEKYIFISPTATATSYFNRSISEMMAAEESVATVTALVEEVKRIAKARRIIVPEDITEKTLSKLRSMPYAATSSMHSDFKSNKPSTELESLTGYVLREAAKLGIDTPTYRRAYEGLVDM